MEDRISAGGIVVADIQSGDILAMTSMPGYDNNNMGPADQPKYTAIVVVYTGLMSNNVYGGKIPALTFKDIVDGIWAYDSTWGNEIKENGSIPQMKEEPISTAKGEDIPVPDLTGLGLKDAIFAIENNGYRFSHSGTGHVVSQTPKAGTKAKKGEKITQSQRFRFQISCVGGTQGPADDSYRLHSYSGCSSPERNHQFIRLFGALTSCWLSRWVNDGQRLHCISQAPCAGQTAAGSPARQPWPSIHN